LLSISNWRYGRGNGNQIQEARILVAQRLQGPEWRFTAESPALATAAPCRLFHFQRRLELVLQLELVHSISPILALGETGIWPWLLIVLFLFPATIWTVISSIKGKRNGLMIGIAIIAAGFGGYGAVALAFSLRHEWPPEVDFLYALAWWLFFLATGSVSLIKMLRSKRRDEVSAKGKAKG
jgi:hypothetical protein